MKALDPIDATPEKRIYSSIIADYDIEKALCELIDNVIDNGKNYGLKEVYVDILLDVSSQTIYVKDNSGGVNNLKNLISPGSTGNDSSKELIGMFGVGTKRATVALAKNICIKTRKNGEHTKILNYDDQWINDPENWFITPYEANKTNEEINDCETVIELSNLIKNFNDLSVKNIKDHFSKVYAYFISEGFLKLNVNSEEVTPLFFNNWSYSPKYTPTKYWNFIDVGDKKVKIEIIAGLSRISNPSGNWGVYIYCNKRLIGKNLQNFEVGFGKGLAGNPHPTISLVNILVFIEGDSKFMPWNSSKSEINYSHPIFKKIQPNLQELVKRYAKISRSLVGNWEEKLFKFSSGEIKEKNISFDRVLSRELPPLPPPKVSEIAAMKDINKGILESKPWTKGIFGGIEAKEIILRKEFSERNIELKADKIYFFEIDAGQKKINFRIAQDADAESENSFKLLYRERIASFYFKKAHQEKIERAFEKKISDLKYKIHFESNNHYIEIA